MMPSTSSPERELRKHFPTVYLTLISILVALAAEGLLERLTSLPRLPIVSLPFVLRATEIGLVLTTAALFWWVIARWASTLPWAFGFFDAIAPLLLLLVLHSLASSVGTGPDRWFAVLGLAGIGGAVNYGYSAHRALRFISEEGSQSSIWPPTAIIGGGGLLSFALSAMSLDPEGHAVRVVANLATTGVVAAFSVIEYRLWRQTVVYHLAKSAAVARHTL